MGLTVEVENTDGYATQVRAGRHTLVADEPRSSGGTGEGMSPHAMVLAALGACTAITLRMYAERKRWPLGAVRVRLGYRDENGTEVVDRSVEVDGDLDDTQRARLAEIAAKTPVTRMLRDGLPVHDAEAARPAG